MKRAAAVLFVTLLVATSSIATVSAADSTHIRLSRTGATVSFGEVNNGLWVTTELGASSEASRDSGTSALLWINQAAYAQDETGEYNRLVWWLEGNTTAFSMTIADRLGSAAVSAIGMPVSRCDEVNGCADGTADINAAFAAVGTIQRSHQRSISTTSRVSMFIYHDVGKYRFATAAVTVDGVTYGPSTGPSDANIYDTQTGWIEMIKAAPGTRALASDVIAYDTVGTPSGRRTGESMFATWASESDGIGTFTVVDAASVQISAKGTKLDQQAVSYAEQVYATDAFGNVTPVSDTFSSGDSSSTTVAVDRTLSIGTLIGATIPVTSCTYVGDEVLCLDTVVHVDGQWTGVGSTTKTQDGSSGGIAGVLLTVYRNVSTHRAATATATVDGVALGISSEASLDRSTIGWHEVHVGR